MSIELLILNSLLTKYGLQPPTLTHHLLQNHYLSMMRNGILGWNERKKLINCTYRPIDYIKSISRSMAYKVPNGLYPRRTLIKYTPELPLVHLDRFILRYLLPLDTMNFLTRLTMIRGWISGINSWMLLILYRHGEVFRTNSPVDHLVQHIGQWE